MQALVGLVQDADAQRKSADVRAGLQDSLSVVSTLRPGTVPHVRNPRARSMCGCF